MSEQMPPPRDEDQQPDRALGVPVPGLPSDWPADGSSAAEFVASGMPESPGQPGAPGMPESPGQSATLGLPADYIGQPPGGQPARSRRRTIIAVAVAAAVVLIGGGIGLAVGLSGGNGVVSYPDTLLGLTRDTSSDAQQAAGQATSGLGVLQGIIVHPAAAIYGTGPSKGMLIVTGQWSAAAKSDGLIQDTEAGAISALKNEGVTDATSFPAGPRGGGLACGDKNLGGQSTIICAVTDNKIFLVVFYVGNASSLSDAATKTAQVRSAVEH